jgi:DNA mismatch repair protein MLH1
MLVNHGQLMQELFQQLALRRFGESSRLNLAEPVPVRAFVRGALDCRDVGWAPEDGDKDHLARKVEEMLKDKAEMLKEYFNIRLTANGMLLALPDLLPGYTPDAAVLPIFLLRLATEVDWEDETTCFTGVAHELGILFSEIPGASDDDVAEATPILANQIFPALKAYLAPPRRLGDAGAVVQVAALEELYKVFERC